MLMAEVISCELALRWTSLDLSDDKSTLVQVMAWCRQATSHFLNQCWPRSLAPYGVIRPQWVKDETISDCLICFVLKLTSCDIYESYCCNSSLAIYLLNCWLILTTWNNYQLKNIFLIQIISVSCNETHYRCLTLMPANKYSHIYHKVWNKITYPFPNIRGYTVEVWEWISNFIPHFMGCDYLSMLGLKLIHVSKKRGPVEVIIKFLFHSMK